MLRLQLQPQFKIMVDIHNDMIERKCIGEKKEEIIPELQSLLQQVQGYQHKKQPQGMLLQAWI